MKLRPYQIEAVRAAEGAKRIVLCAPTGSGKTVIAVELIARELAAGRRVLFAAHRRELIRQPFCKLIRYGIDPDLIGVIMAGIPSGRVITPGGDSDAELWRAHARYKPSAPVQVASIDTLRNHETPPEFDLLLIDEAHRSLAKSYVDLIAARPDARVVGLTATPVRGDGRGLAEVYDDLHVVAEYAELAAAGYLVTPRVWSSGQLPDLSSVRVRGSDYDPTQLSAACDRPELVGDIVAHYQRHGNGAPCLVFAAGVEHSKRIVEQFCAAGYVAKHVDGSTKSSYRDQAFDGLATGKVQVVSNCDVATEGTDIPCVKCVISARPTMSVRVWMQQCGRGSRPHDGKFPFVILDHSGNATRHGLPQMAREWSLSARPKRSAKKSAQLPPAWTCNRCYGVNEITATECGECGAERPAATKREIVERAGELVELSPDLYSTAWQVVVDEWRQRNAKRSIPTAPDWCRKRYRERFGIAAPPGIPLPSLSPEQARTRDRYVELLKTAKARGYDRKWVFVKLKEERAAAEAQRRPLDTTGELIEWAV